MPKSDIKVPKCYEGFLALVGKVLSQSEQVRNIIYARLIGDEEVFLFSCSSFYPGAYIVYTVSYFLQSWGNFGGSKLKHHSLAILIPRKYLNQLRPTIHVD